ncbi:Pol polyprotein [Elysia marginata]|uniref:Pol polyprotein n=1 Tax=Elysia marginata TaxID=1093978 RepID=A0AAV4GHM8_9GAST|nr:Pol polyprotein [Elysia marginata]
MANALPNFPPFRIREDELSAGTRWRKWFQKFENFITALDITNGDRKKALLIHFGVDEIFDLVDTFPEEKKNTYEALKTALETYFTPRVDTTFESSKLRKMKQLATENVDQFHKLSVLGCFTTNTTQKESTILAKFYEVDGNRSCSNLLSGATSEKTWAHKVPEPRIQIKVPAELYRGFGKIKNIKVKLHIDHKVQPRFQAHRRIPYHVRKDLEKELQRLEEQDIIENVVGPTPWVSPIVVVPKKTGVTHYTDDIIIHGADKATHDTSLTQTLNLQERDATLNKEKCLFGVNKLTFLGHTFGQEGISPEPQKIQAIVNTKKPSSVSELRSFLGMTQFVSRYIESYSTITEPLRKLTRNSQKWQWGKDQNKAFNKLKDRLTQVGVIAYFDPKKETEILVDASPCGLGAILTQQGKIVCYAGRALTDVETRYSQTEREMLAVVYGVEKFHMYLYGSSDFTVTTDHKPLLGIIKSMKPCSARIERWRLRLMPYQFKLIYRPGKDEAKSSRFPLSSSTCEANTG